MSDFERFYEVEKLDESGHDLLIVRTIQNHRTQELVKLSVVYLHIESGERWLIFRADGSQSERVHAHYFFRKSEQKQYHNKGITYTTIAAYAEQIRLNWRWYLIQYKENYI